MNELELLHIMKRAGTMSPADLAGALSVSTRTVRTYIQRINMALSQHTVDLEHLPYFLFSFAVFDHGYNPTNAFDSMCEKGVQHGQIHRILL